MASTLNFGPQWLRTLSDSGANVQGPSLLPPSAQPSQSAPHSFAPPTYKLADHRYGREEMLALYTDKSSVTVDLSDASLMLPKPELPMALLPMSEEEQALLLQNVNSTLSMKTYGGRGGGGGIGMTSMRGGGRGDSDRGRGRGRGRDEEGYGRRPRDPWEDGYNRGGGRSYDRGGYHGEQNGPPVGGGNNRDNISRSMSTDNWREAKANPEEEGGEVRRGGGGGGLASGSRGWGTQRNWREPREPTDRRPPNDYESGSRPNRYPPPEEPVRKIEYRRSRSSGSAMFDEDGGQDVLPEWSTVDAEELESGGSFDATGAFLFSKENARGARKAASDIDLTAKKHPPSSADPGRSFEHETDRRDDYSGGRVPSSGGGGGTGASSRDKNNRQLRVNENDNPDRGLSEATASLSVATADERQAGGGRTVSGPSTVGMGGNSPRNSTRNSNAPSSSSASLQNGQPGGFSTAESGVSAQPPVAAVAAFPRLPAATAKEGATTTAPQRMADSNAPKTVSSTGSSSVGKPQSAAGLPASEPVIHNTPSPPVDDQWFYRDPQGEVQGPFKNSEMAEWFTAGFFTMTLEIKAGTNGTFTTLGDLIATCGCIPFTASNPSPLMPTALGMAGVASTVSGQPVMLDPAFQEQFKMQQQMLQQQHQIAAAAAVAQQQYIISQQLHMLHAQQQQQQLVNSGSIPGMLGMPGGGALPVGVPMATSVYGGMMQPGMMPGIVGGMVRPNTDTALSGQATQPGGAAAPGTRPTSNRLAEPPSIWNIDPGLQVTSQRDEQLVAAAREREETERRRAEQERAEAARRAQQEQAERQAAERQAAAAAAEKRRQEEEWQKAEEQRRRAEEVQRKAEDEKQRQEMERRRVAEAEESKRKEMMRLKKEEEDRMREEKRQMEERMEWHRQEDLVKRLEHERQAAAVAQREKQRIEELRAKQVTSKPAPWLNASASVSGTNLSQIQKNESERLQAELFEAEHQRMIVEEQMRQMEMIQRQKQQQALSWRERAPAPPTPPAATSLLEIQLEQERQLAEEKNIQLQAAKSMAPDLPLGMAAVWGGTAAPPRRDGFGGGSIWDNVDTSKKTKAPPAATGAHNAQFPALPAAAAKKPAAQNKTTTKAVAKTKKAEETVQKLFETTKSKDDFTKWCEAVLQGLETSVDIPTLVEFLKDIESPYEVQDYIRNYLGESKQVTVFAQQFLEKRSKMRNAAKPKQEDGLWGPPPALNPQLSRQQQSAAAGTKQQPPKQHGQQSGKQAAASTGGGTASAAGAGGKKKKKMQKVDSSVLGFTVIADPQRTNYGELDKV